MLKLKKLQNEISTMVNEGICIAFSGGVDSSLILKVACEEGKKQNKKIYAVTFDTRLHPVSDVEISKKVAMEMGAVHNIIKIDELENKSIINNPVDRCYQCKKMLFLNLINFAKENKLKYILDGTNSDDLKVYRPGIKALRELKIISPLANLDINKEEVRLMAEILNISVANRPSSPCMATRLPYNTEINYNLLEKIDKGEEFIRKLGFPIIRLRVHKDIVRIEINSEDFVRFLEYKDIVLKYLKELGFIYITLDLEGFRSGSMDIYLETNNEKGERG